jgi:hypothetical protein
MRDKRTLSESDITKHTWGFEWDDIEKAAKEMREETFGPDSDIPSDETLCFECGEVKSKDDFTGHSIWCEFCGYNFEESKLSRKYMAQNIDLGWQLMNEEERKRFKKVMKILRSVSPEFRQMWKKEADQAALNRRYENG